MVSFRKYHLWDASHFPVGMWEAKWPSGWKIGKSKNKWEIDPKL